MNNPVKRILIRMRVLTYYSRETYGLTNKLTVKIVNGVLLFKLSFEGLLNSNVGSYSEPLKIPLRLFWPKVLSVFKLYWLDFASVPYTEIRRDKYFF